MGLLFSMEQIDVVLTVVAAVEVTVVGGKEIFPSLLNNGKDNS